MLTLNLNAFLMVNFLYKYNRSSQGMEYIELVGDVVVISQNGFLNAEVSSMNYSTRALGFISRCTPQWQFHLDDNSSPKLFYIYLPFHITFQLSHVKIQYFCSPKEHQNTHTHTHRYIYIYIYMNLI
jgi:5-keto 4-deoxyuronate isomerase